MTWTVRAQWASKIVACFCFVSLLAACASILGIEERKEDSAGSYPLAGYRGCSEGDCTGCLAVHREECQLRTACASAAGNNTCAGCVCQNCLEPVVDCQLDQGCAAIWQCLGDTRCDLSERASGSCGDACGTIIQANGGLSGPAFRAAAAIRTCAATAACLNCLAPQVQQTTRACTQANGCQDCPDCFDQCLCSGEKFGECQRLCGAQAPPAACTEADSCAGCTNCFDACACGGKSYGHCVNACTTTSPQPTPDPTPTPAVCSPDDGCIGCAGCSAQCVCSGDGDKDLCDTLCSPQQTSDECEEDPRGPASSCGGCRSCIAKETCPGQSMAEALQKCDQQDCSGDGFNACTCTFDSAACFNMNYGSCDSFGACEACACQQCPGELGMCLETYGCQQPFDCMRTTNCQGSACFERCHGDASPEAFAFAEALWACYKGARCSCNDNVPPPVQCPGSQGSVECQGYVSDSLGIAACCPSSILIPLQTTGAQTTPDANACGLALSTYYRNARDCEPREQSSPPRYKLIETCPDATIPTPPYNGALLPGCCRGADGTCGYFDDITGLGCLSASIFGGSTQLCGRAASASK